MAKHKDIQHCLLSEKIKRDTAEEKLIGEAHKILKDDLFSEKNILQNLGQYKEMDHFIEEEQSDESAIFDAQTIYQIAVNYRLKFLDSEFYKREIPYDAVLKIKAIEAAQKKDLKHFKILSEPTGFKNKDAETQCSTALFARTIHDNYFLIHQWGQPLQTKRKIKYWPLRNFESLAVCLILITCIEGLLMPNSFIVRDIEADYWNGYRGGTFFHLLIINTGFAAYLFVAFAKNFSANLWNKKNDRD